MAKKSKPEDVALLEHAAPSLSDRLSKLRNAAGKITGKWGLTDAVAIPGQEPEAFAKRVYSTGLLSLDYTMGIGGFPRGHIVELYGSPSGGKSLLVYNMIREVQKQNGLFVLFDQENSFDPVWAAKQGVDINSMLVMKLPSGEQAIDMIRMVMNQHKPEAIAIDSIAQLQPATEQERSAVDDSTMMGLHAKIMSQLCRHITSCFLEDPKNAPLFLWVNQMRADVSGYGADKVTGGFAPEYYSSIRIKLLRQKALNSSKPEAGFGGKMTIKKCKAAQGVQNKSLEYAILPTGFDVITDAYTTAVAAGAFKTSKLQTGGHYWNEDEAAENKLASSRAEFMDKMRSDEALFTELRDRVLSLMKADTAPMIYVGDISDTDIEIEGQE